jgi:hypothetical protein
MNVGEPKRTIYTEPIEGPASCGGSRPDRRAGTGPDEGP